MAKPFNAPANERGRRIVARLQEQGHWPVTKAALRLGTYGFMLLHKLLHVPSFHPRPATRAVLRKRLGLHAALLLPEAAPVG